MLIMAALVCEVADGLPISPVDVLRGLNAWLNSSSGELGAL